jgi:S-methylmethionine-dependent homocysteine/selenocysteine methylase
MPSISFNLFTYARKINHPLILDGAIGSLLQQKDVDFSTPLWSSYANIKNPEAVFHIHEEYIKAGADIITTNTFRTNPAAVKRSGLKYDYKKMVLAGVQIAKEASKGKNVLVAGSNPPAEDSYHDFRTLTKNELKNNHHLHIEALISSGCNLILNETQSHMDEIEIICKYCTKNEISFIISLFVKEDLTMLSGEKLQEVLDFITDYQPLAVGFNCIADKTLKRIVRRVKMNFNWGFYLNCGSGSFTDKVIKCGITPKDYTIKTAGYLNKKPSFIGACCGSRPAHIKELYKLINEKDNYKITGQN